MRKLKLKGIVAVTALSIILTGCSAKNENLTNNNEYNSNTVYEEQYSTKPVIEQPTQEDIIIESNTSTETTQPPLTETSPALETESKEEFTFFKDAKEEIIRYIESDDFEKLKTQGKYYVTTGIDFIFFDAPINGLYFDDLTEELKADIIRDVKGLDETIMAYYPDYKESFSSKYQVATEFVSEKYLAALDAIKEYLGEENYNAVGEIKDQIKEDVSNKASEVVEDIKELYKGWKNN